MLAVGIRHPQSSPCFGYLADNHKRPRLFMSGYDLLYVNELCERLDDRISLLFSCVVSAIDCGKVLCNMIQYDFSISSLLCSSVALKK